MPEQRRHWKWHATRCAVEGCEEQRRKGWSTCSVGGHYRLGKSLYGAGQIAPIPCPPKRGLDTQLSTCHTGPIIPESKEST